MWNLELLPCTNHQSQIVTLYPVGISQTCCELVIVKISSTISPTFLSLYQFLRNGLELRNYYLQPVHPPVSPKEKLKCAHVGTLCFVSLQILFKEILEFILPMQLKKFHTSCNLQDWVPKLHSFPYLSSREKQCCKEPEILLSILGQVKGRERC